VQSARQSGLSAVYTDLLDFEGDEIYMTPARSLAGRTFHALLFAFRTSSVIGLQRADGTTLLNPPMDTILEENDQVILIAEDDTTERSALEAAGVGTYGHVMVLSYDDIDGQRADSRTLVTLLHLREMAARVGERYSVVSEMTDDRNRALAEVTSTDDFIVSDK